MEESLGDKGYTFAICCVTWVTSKNNTLLLKEITNFLHLFFIASNCIVSCNHFICVFVIQNQISLLKDLILFRKRKTILKGLALVYKLGCPSLLLHE